MTPARSASFTPVFVLPRLVALLAILGPAGAGPAGADPAADAPAAPRVAEWNQFRGPYRSGVSEETGLLDAWPEGGPAILWKRAIGEGFSGIAVSGGKLFTLDSAGEIEYLVAFVGATGEELWRTPIGDTFHESFGNGPRSTPTVVGDVVYALGAKGRLLAARAADGETIWQVELQGRYPIVDPQALAAMAPTAAGPQLPLFGYAGSPLVEGELIVLHTGAGHGRSLVALDKRTGEERWAALDDEISYSSPVALDLAGRRQLVVVSGASLVGLSLAGEVLWRHPWAITASQPLQVGDDRLFVSTVNDVGALLLQVVAGDGALTPVEGWRNRRMKNAWNSSIVLGDHIYGFDNATLRCVAVADGDLLWAERGFGQGNLVVAGDLAVVLSDLGEVFLVKLRPEGAEVKGSVQVLAGRSWTPPTLAGGVLYLRNHTEMAAVRLADAAAPSSSSQGEAP